MKLLKLAKLGHRNITHHKKQTILTVIVIGSLFGVLIATQMIIQGVENVFLRQFDQIFPEKTYLIANGCSNNEIKAFENNNSCFNQLDERESDDDKSLLNCLIELNKKPYSCGNNTAKTNELFNKKAQNHGGKVVGNVKQIVANSSDTSITLYPEGVFKHLIAANIAQKPQDALTTVVSFENAARLVNSEYSSRLDNAAKLALVKEVHEKVLGKAFDHGEHKIFVAGILPYGSTNPKLAKHERDFRPIDIFLGNVLAENSTAVFYLDDDSEALQKLLKDSTTKFHQTIIEFKDNKQAYDFCKHQMQRPDPALISEFEPKNPEYNVFELITGKIGTMYNFKASRFLLSFVNYVLLLTAIVIIVFTFVRLLNQDNKIMALYRSLGATATDVFLIYFWYILELCVLAVFYACAVAGILAFAVSNYYSADFNAAFSLFFSKNLTDFKLFIGFNQEIWQIIALILLSAPLVSILTIDQLSMKNIARRLKQQ